MDPLGYSVELVYFCRLFWLDNRPQKNLDHGTKMDSALGRVRIQDEKKENTNSTKANTNMN